MPVSDAAPVRPLRSHYQADHGRKARLRSCERKYALTETEGLMNQEITVGLIILFAVGFILAKLPKTSGASIERQSRTD
jgi:hypothetical protein